METTTWYWYWLDDGKVQITEDANVAEKALREHKQIWGGCNGNIDLGPLGAVGDSEIISKLADKIRNEDEQFTDDIDTMKVTDDDVDDLEEIATIFIGSNSKMVGIGKGNDGPFVVVYDGSAKIYKSNPITMWGARRLYEKILMKLVDEGGGER
jgi:hypothetical protein